MWQTAEEAAAAAEASTQNDPVTTEYNYLLNW